MAIGAAAIGAASPAAADSPRREGHQPRPRRSRATRASIAAAYSFLAVTFDQYGSGGGLRLPQSYTGGYFDTIGFVSSFTYDNALVICAWLAEGSAANVQRAKVLGDTLLYAQHHDPIGDGRTRASYQPNPFITADGSPYVGSPAANTGNQAWLGMAFMQLHHRSGDASYLQGALVLAGWIHDKTFDSVRSPVGYTGGRNGDDVAYTFKATEHNIDVGAFFAMLADATGDTIWSTRSATAFAFVAAMQDTPSGKVWTGTGPDGSTINTFPLPADVQTWASLATGDTRYDRAVDWVVANLMTTDGPFSGSSYSDADVTKVWFEGTGHLALALHGTGADARLRNELLDTLESAQALAPNTDGQGIVAASSDGLDTGFGDLYYAALHTGATAWYLLATKSFNPFLLGG